MPPHMASEVIHQQADLSSVESVMSEQLVHYVISYKFSTPEF